ncbi:hypothetical protein N493_19870 (plasmid) [Clostridium botulinum B2 433]|uniref:hypothetical protein n=1 Tax=Clostridium botulinum TaxID=1491 RepID=UPI0007DFDEE7|nr:hypothetical protein [Clostridium botulinum]KEI84147.1 hypothetical protein N493_19870 [Clostridium botulinum B2 433]
MYKKYIAKKKLKNICQYCGCSFNKDDLYYKERIVVECWDSGHIYGYNNYICPKCKYKEKQHIKRFERFRNNCIHPKEFVEEIWSYIPGECVKQPDHLECRLCGKIL